MSEELTRAAKKKTGTTSKKTGASTNKKTSSSTKKKTTTSSKKKTTSTSIKLSAAEKKLITNYRKCNALEKEIISILTEKAAGGLTKLDGMNHLLNS